MKTFLSLVDNGADSIGPPTCRPRPARSVLLALGLALATATSYAGPSYGTATVDGQIGEWDLIEDYVADLYHGWDPAKGTHAKVYMRYDCDTETLYFLALQTADSKPVLTQTKEAWVKLGGKGGSGTLVDDTSGNNGVPPDFAWYGLGYAGNGTARGWEASISIAPGTYTFSVHQNSRISGEEETVGNDGAVTVELTCTPVPPEELLFDLGDAPTADQSGFPNSYPTLLMHDGAHHRVVPGFLLGQTVDEEEDGQPTATADGDDLNGIPDDEDGVLFTSTLRRGQNASLEVSLLNTAGLANPSLDAWVDWNRDGDWDDPGEQIFTSEPLTAGVNALTFAVPSGAALGTTYARFRLSNGGGLTPRGMANEGEVEDYMVQILPGDDPPPTAARLGDFSAAALGLGQVELSWSTLVETGVLGFRVERRSGAGAWERLPGPIVPATGWSGLPQRYHWKDSQASPATALTYRLIEVALNGRESVLAEAPVTETLHAALVRSHTGLSLKIAGPAGARVRVEGAPDVTGPWSAEGALSLDGQGTGTLSVGHAGGEPARFFRVTTE